MADFSPRSRDSIRNRLRSALIHRQETETEEEDTQQQPNNAGSESASENDEPEENAEALQPPSRSRDPYREGTTVFETQEFRLKVKSVKHIRRTRYMLSDHLYSMWIERKNRTFSPLLSDLEDAIEQGLVAVLNRLKNVYIAHHQYQIYVTIISDEILSGLNSGNYSLQTPANKIARWMLSMLYNYLKSNQSMRLDSSFKIQIKVLSIQHTRNLERNNPRFRRHIYH